MMGSMFIKVTDDVTNAPVFLNADLILKFEQIDIGDRKNFRKGTCITLALKELSEEESDMGYRQMCVYETPEEIFQWLP